jgi:hypothetical protein
MDADNKDGTIRFDGMMWARNENFQFTFCEFRITLAVIRVVMFICTKQERADEIAAGNS